MPLIDFKLAFDMRLASTFNGIGSKKFFDGIAKGVIKSVQTASVKILFTGSGGSPGIAIIQGISTSDPQKMLPFVQVTLLKNTIIGIASVKLALGLSQIARDLKTDSTTFVKIVTNGALNVSQGIGTIPIGGIVLNVKTSRNLIIKEMAKAMGGPITEASKKMAFAVAESLRNYLLSLSYVIPVTGGATSGSAAFTLTGKFLK